MKTYCLIDFHNKNNLRSLTELHTSMQKQSVEKFDNIALIITCLHYNVLMFTPKIKCLKLFYCDGKKSFIQIQYRKGKLDQTENS